MAELDRPIKTIFVSIFDMLGNQLATTEDQDDVSVVSFRYKYDDEDEDICTIKLQMRNPKALNKFRVERGTKLQCVWGYIGNPISPVTTVVVRDLTSKYGREVIYTELICTDYLAYLKVTRSDDIGEGAFIDYIRAQVYGRYNIVIKDRGERIYAQVRRKEYQSEDRLVPVNVPDYGPPYEGIFFDPIDEAPEGSKSILINQKPTQAGTWFVDVDHPVRVFLEEKQSIPTSNRSTFIVMQDIFKKCPRGPWFITGRGDTLLIHNRNLGKGVYKQYKYKSEEIGLIDFTAKTKFENFDKEVISYAGMDPQDRKNFFIDDYRKALYELRTPKEVLKDRKISDEMKKYEIEKYLNLRNVPYGKFGVTEIEGAYFNPGTPEQRFWPGHFDKPFKLKDGYPGLAVPDNTRVVNPDPFVRSSEGPQFDPYIHDVILRALWYTLPMMTYEEAVNVTNNRQRELAMDKEEGNVILEGDPWMKSELTLRITNVHKQHEGHYYVKVCEHIITNQGYKVELDCIKVVPEAMMTIITNFSKEEYEAMSEEVKELIKEQYKREQYIFGSNISVTYWMEERDFVAIPGVELKSPILQSQYKTITLRDLFDKYEPDEAIDRLIRLASDPKSIVDFKPENK